MNEDTISREEVLSYITTMPLHPDKSDIDDLEDFIKSLPATDAEKVVRCKDCEKWEETDTFDNGKVFGICSRCCGCMTEDSFFCGDGQ